MRIVVFTFWIALLGYISSAAMATDNDYTLASGDVVHITVYDHPDLTTDNRVGSNGEINFPLIGNIKVGGLGLRKAEAILADSLNKGGFIRDPQVNINIIQYRGQQVDVLGYVNRPGRFPLEKSSTVSDLLAMASGIAAGGADRIILIHRDGKNTTRTEIDAPDLMEKGDPKLDLAMASGIATSGAERIIPIHRDGKNTTRTEIDALDLMEKGDPKLDLDMRDGDILFVPREPRYYIYGEVQRPGTFRLERNMTVVQALSVGGGLTPRGTQKGIRILRRNEQGKTVEIETKLEASVQPDDVIYVKESLF